MIQPDLFTIHAFEKPSESQSVLERERIRLSRNCSVLFDALMRGEYLNSVVVVQRYGIIDWRRRCCDLQENGVRLSWKPSSLGRGLRDWYMTAEEMEANKIKLHIK